MRRRLKSTCIKYEAHKGGGVNQMLRRITAQGGQCLPDGLRKSQATYGRKTMKHVFIAALSLFMIGGVLPASANTIYIQDSGAGLQSEAMGGGDLTRWGADY